MTTESAAVEPVISQPSVSEWRSWQIGIGPRYIALFLPIVFYDRLALNTLQVGGLGPSLLGAIVAALTAFGLFFYPSASLGLRTRKGFLDLAARSFGRTGSRGIAGVFGVAQVLMFAATLYYAVDLTMHALVQVGLLKPSALELSGVVFQTTVVLWIVPAAVLGPMLVHLVAAILYVYVLFPAMIFGGLMVWALWGLPSYQHISSDPVTSWRAFAVMIQLVLGYFATSGVTATDWGAGSEGAKDVRLGGLVGVVMAPIVIVCIALVTVAGLLGRFPAVSPTYTMVLVRGIGGRWGGVLMFFCTLGLLGPACYTPTVFCRAFRMAWPRPKPWVWSLLGAVLAWPLVATGWAGRLELVFGVVGALAAPILGCLAADAIRDRSDWEESRPGLDVGGLIAWLVGCLVGLAPYVGPTLGWSAAARFQPAVLVAFAAAFLIKLTAGLVGIEARTSAVEASVTPAP